MSCQFLSTLSLRRATRWVRSRRWRSGDFYPRSPCGERLQRQIEFERYSDISIHALLAESDTMGPIPALTAAYFYPRSPCGERHSAPVPCGPDADISIHALLAESDCQRLRTQSSVHPFLSTLSLRRATSSDRKTYIRNSLFLSTLSLRRATRNSWSAGLWACISIHALLAESDVKGICFNAQIPKFLSTLSLRRATSQCRTLASGIYDFYPRSPCGERPIGKYAQYAVTGISIHALLAESDGLFYVI